MVEAVGVSDELGLQGSAKQKRDLPARELSFGGRGYCPRLWFFGSEAVGMASDARAELLDDGN